MKALEIYNKISGNKRRAEKLAQEILNEIEKRYGTISYPWKLDSLNKILFLLKVGCAPSIMGILMSHGYTYEIELQYILANMGYYARMDNEMQHVCTLSKMPSLNYMFPSGSGYIIDCKLGRIMATPLNRWEKDLKVCRYASLGSGYAFCHDMALHFITKYPEYEAVTSLVPYAFQERQYHSYVRSNEDIIDFAHNMHMSKEDYEKIMSPMELNSVHGYELEEKEATLTEDDLGPNKNLLVRLAVSKQRRM